MNEYLQAVEDIKGIISRSEEDIRRRVNASDTYTLGQLDILTNLRTALNMLIMIKERKDG